MPFLLQHLFKWKVYIHIYIYIYIYIFMYMNKEIYTYPLQTKGVSVVFLGFLFRS